VQRISLVPSLTAARIPTVLNIVMESAGLMEHVPTQNAALMLTVNMLMVFATSLHLMMETSVTTVMMENVNQDVPTMA